MSDLTQTIETAAQTPQSASGDGMSVSARPLKDLIEADAHIRSVEAAKPGNIVAALRGMMLKIVPPGAH